MKPVINLDELEMVHDDSGQSYGIISDNIGAKKLGYNLSVLPKGAELVHFHNHHVAEEMFFILEGEGILRFGDQEYPLRPNDVIACPPGGQEVAHQIRCTSDTPLKFLALGTRETSEIVEYPDVGRVMVASGPEFQRNLRLVFPAESAL